MNSGQKSCKVDKLLQLAEQSVLLVGQTNVIVNYNRRLNVLSRFLKNPKAAHEILKQNEQTLKANKTTLFGFIDVPRAQNKGGRSGNNWPHLTLTR